MSDDNQIATINRRVDKMRNMQEGAEDEGNHPITICSYFDADVVIKEDEGKAKKIKLPVLAIAEFNGSIRFYSAPLEGREIASKNEVVEIANLSSTVKVYEEDLKSNLGFHVQQILGEPNRGLVSATAKKRDILDEMLDKVNSYMDSRRA